MPDSRFLPVEPVLCIVALIAIAVCFCWVNDLAHLRPGPAEKDAIYVLYHDGSETEELADDVSVFMGKVRQAAHGPS